MGYLLKIVLIAVCIYYVLKWAFRLLLKVFFTKLSDNYGSSAGYNKSKIRKEGEVHVEKMPKQKKNIDKDTGEYIDYEEVN